MMIYEYDFIVKEVIKKMEDINVGALFHITEKGILEIPKSERIRRSRYELAGLLAEIIVNKHDFFTEQKMDDGGIQYRAEAYVLTPKAFDELVERIRRDVLWTPMLGGIS